MVQRGNASDVAARIADAEGWPEESWWTKPNFYQNAEAQQGRMRRSRFGRMDMLATSRDMAQKAKPPSASGDDL